MIQTEMEEYGRGMDNAKEDVHIIHRILHIIVKAQKYPYMKQEIEGIV